MKKTLLLDIETSYMKLAGFSLKADGYFSHNNIIEDWYILCAAWKWLGKPKIYGAISDDKHNDKEVVIKLREAVLEADELIYHNGAKFDYKKLNARVILNGLGPMVKPREIDTLKQARKHFSFTSNRLDYLGKVLGCGGKIHTGNDLWLRALDRDEQALKEMFKYNKRDVTLLEDVYKKLAPHIDVGYNANLMDVLNGCPLCGSMDYHQRGWALTKTCKYQRYVCLNCGKWFQDGTAVKRDDGPINR